MIPPSLGIGLQDCMASVATPHVLQQGTGLQVPLPPAVTPFVTDDLLPLTMCSIHDL